MLPLTPRCPNPNPNPGGALKERPIPHFASQTLGNRVYRARVFYVSTLHLHPTSSNLTIGPRTPRWLQAGAAAFLVPAAALTALLAPVIVIPK